MIIIKLRFLKIRLGRQFLAAILGRQLLAAILGPLQLLSAVLIYPFELHAQFIPSSVVSLRDLCNSQNLTLCSVLNFLVIQILS
jgi:hypothetical protein